MEAPKRRRPAFRFLATLRSGSALLHAASVASACQNVVSLRLLDRALLLETGGPHSPALMWSACEVPCDDVVAGLDSRGRPFDFRSARMFVDAGLLFHAVQDLCSVEGRLCVQGTPEGDGIVLERASASDRGRRQLPLTEIEPECLDSWPDGEACTELPVEDVKRVVRCATRDGADHLGVSTAVACRAGVRVFRVEFSYRGSASQSAVEAFYASDSPEFDPDMEGFVTKYSVHVPVHLVHAVVSKLTKSHRLQCVWGTPYFRIDSVLSSSTTAAGGSTGTGTTAACTSVRSAICPVEDDA